MHIKIHMQIHLYLHTLHLIFLLASIGKDRSYPLFALPSPYCSVLLRYQAGLASHLDFGLSSLARYIWTKLIENLGCQVYSIFSFCKMKITFKKPSHKCLFNSSWLLPWDWISIFVNIRCLEANTKWLSKTAGNLLPVALLMMAGMWLRGSPISSFVRDSFGRPSWSGLLILTNYSLPLR